MAFRPTDQLSTILKQQYFEPTISWSLRVVLALNVPLIVIPLFRGFSYEVIWSAFGAYMLSLIDYRGMHYRKIIIQVVTAGLSFVAALSGMYVAHSVLWSVIAMFVVGMIAAIIRNYSDYGPSIAVSLGFFFLLGLAAPLPLDAAITSGLYLLTGCAWAITITLLSFPFQPSSPVRRSVARIWKANTEFLDVIVQKLVSDKELTSSAITEKELAVRKAIDESRNLFAIRENKERRSKTQHYDQMLELRKTASLFAATVSSLHEELEVINTGALQAHPDISFYKTLSAFAQAGARLSILMFTFRAADFALAKIRVKRCEVAVELFTSSVSGLKRDGKEEIALRHFTESLRQALGYLQLSLTQAQEKLSLEQSDYFENYKLSFQEFIAGFKPEALGDFVGDVFRVNLQQLNYALRVAMGLALGVFIFKFFHIDHGNWIALTMMIVIQPYYGATLKKGVERIIGTLAGIILGGLILLLPLSHEAIVLLLIADSFFVAYFLRNNYKVGVFFVTIMMVLLMQISQQGNWQLIGWRIASTLIGAGLALLAGYAFWPVWEKERFPALLVRALQQNKIYVKQLLRYLQNDLPAGESWSKYRRLAEGANNLVFASAQRMLEEPRYARQPSENSFALVGANIRISREITSVALSATSQKLAGVAAFGGFYMQLELITEDLSAKIAGNASSSIPLDFQPLKQSLAGEALTGSNGLLFIRQEFEKIVFELEAMDSLLKH